MAQPIAVSKANRGVAQLDNGLSGYTMADMVREILSRLGEDPSRDGLINTPVRVEKSLEFLTKGYDQDPNRILRGALLDVD